MNEYDRIVFENNTLKQLLRESQEREAKLNEMISTIKQATFLHVAKLVEVGNDAAAIREIAKGIK